jgi:ABC-type uncharacterized transport system involved in gliding motility auxiliary subunit
VRFDRRLALAGAAVGVVLLLSTLGFVLADGAVSRRTALLLAAGLALVAVYVLVDPGAVAALVPGRPGRPGSQGAVASAAVVGILVGVNVLASRDLQSADLTRSGLHTLSARSVQVTGQLDSDLVVTGFFRSDEQQTERDAQSLLDLYRQQSPHVKVRYVDPAQDPALAGALGATISGSVVLQYRTRVPVVLNQAEQSESDVTAAILRLESMRSPTVCWAAGEGERDLKDTNEVSGYSAAADLLRTSDYQVQEVLLVQQGIPGACDVLALLQLGAPLADATVRTIQAYLARGGKLLLAVDPWLDPRVVASANAVLQPYGVAFDGGLVVEPDPAHAAVGDPAIPIVYGYGASPITRDLAGRYVFFPEATGIAGTAGSGATSIDLASTTGDAYAIRQQRTSLDRRATDEAGPFVLMQSIEEQRPQGTTRIVLAGTSALAENATMPPAASGSNPDLLLASLDWLSEQDSLIAIAPKPPQAAALSLSDRDLRVNDLLTVAVLPLLVVAIGMLVRARRRRPPA